MEVYFGWVWMGGGECRISGDEWWWSVVLV